MPNNLPTKNLLEKYSRYLESCHLSKSSRYNYVADLRRFGDWFESNKGRPLAPGVSVSKDLSDYLLSLELSGTSRGTLGRYRSSLERFLRWDSGEDPVPSQASTAAARPSDAPYVSKAPAIQRKTASKRVRQSALLRPRYLFLVGLVLAVGLGAAAGGTFYESFISDKLAGLIDAGSIAGAVERIYSSSETGAVLAERVLSGFLETTVDLVVRKNAVVESDFSAGGGAFFVDAESGAVGVGTTSPGGALDVSGGELVLDVDGDTSLIVSTDDQIEVQIGGGSDFQFTANSFEVLGSSFVSMADDTWVGLSPVKGRLVFDDDGDYLKVQDADLRIYDDGESGYIQLSESTISGPGGSGLTVSNSGGDLSIETTSSGNILLTSAAEVVISASAFDLNNSGAVTIGSDGSEQNITFEVASFDVNSTSAITIDGGLTNIGSGSYSHADGDNDLGVAGDLEVLGTLYAQSQTTAGHLLPAADDAYDIGSTTLEWRNAYFDGTLMTDLLKVDSTSILTGAATFSSSAAITSDLTVDTSTLYVDATDNRVGVGTTDPQALLHVGSGGTPASIDGTNDIYVQNDLEVGGTIYGSLSGGVTGTLTPGFTEGSVVFTNAAGELTSDTPNLFWDDTGNYLGIGTSNPSTNLAVNGTTLLGGGTQIIDNANLSFGGSNDVVIVWETADADTHYFSTVLSGSHNWVISADDSIDWGYSAQTDPTFYIHSADALTLADYISLSHNQTNAEIVVGAGDLNITTGGSQRLTVDSDGNIGVGTTSPSQKLTVQGTLGILEGGSSPIRYTILQGGDQATDVTYTLPTADGGANQVLSTSGAGVLAWIDVSAGSGGLWINGGDYLTPTGGESVQLGQEDWIGIGAALERIVFDGTNDDLAILGADLGVGTTSPQALLHVGVGGTPATIDGTNDLYVQNDLEVGGTIYGSISGGVIGTLTPGFTQGSLVFTNAGGELSSDTPNIFWDDSSNYLGVGTSAPSAAIDIGGGVANYIDGASDLLIAGDLEVDNDFYVGGDMTLVGVSTHTGNIQLNDDIELQFGSSSDARFLWETADSDAHFLSTVLSGTNNWIISADNATDWGHASSSNPTIYLQSADQATTSDYLKLWHDQTDARIDVGAGKLHLGTGGSRMLTVDTGGNVGIGTTGPGAKLEVDTTSTNTVLKLSRSADSVWSAFAHGNAGSENGYLNITQSGANSSLHYYGSAAVQRVVFQSTQENIVVGPQTDSSVRTGVIRSTNATGTDVGGSNLRLRGGRGTGTGVGGYLAFETTPSGGGSGSSLNSTVERMRIDSNGNVGIGTTVPQTLLTLGKNTAYANTIRIYYKYPAYTGIYGEISHGGTGYGLKLVSQRDAFNNAGHIDFFTSSSDVAATQKVRFHGSGGVSVGDVYVSTDPGADNITIEGKLGIGYSTLGTGTLAISGNVGIGTTNPVQKLHVEGQCVTGDTLLSIAPSESQAGQDSSQFTDHRSQTEVHRSQNGSFGADQSSQITDHRVQIKDVKPGTLVYSLNEETGKVEPRRINKLLDMGVKPVFKLITESGKEIRTTGNHPYLVQLTQDELQERIQLREVGSLEEGYGIHQGDLSEDFEFSETRTLWSDGSTQESGNLDPSEHCRGEWSLQQEGVCPVPLSSQGISLRDSSLPQTGSGTPVPYGTGSGPAPGSSTRDQQNDQWASQISKEPLWAKVETSSLDHRSQITDHSSNWAKVIYLQKGDLVATISSNCQLRTVYNEPLVGDEYSCELRSVNCELDSEVGDYCELSTVNCEPYVVWDKIQSIEYVGEDQVYDIEVEDTHNFIANGILAHNTYLSGNVGIGTTSPGALFQTGTTLYGMVQIKDDGRYLVATGWPGSIHRSEETLLVNPSAANDARWIFTVAEGSNTYLTVRGNGNVGIGTTGPNHQLSVSRASGNATMASVEYGANDWLVLYQDDGYDASIFWESDDDLRLGTSTSSTGVGWSEKMRITNDGNVGIGTTEPGAKLDILNSSASNGLAFLGTTTLQQATGSEVAYQLNYTTNKATSGNDTGLVINMTDTASPGSSKLLDLQVNGDSRHYFTNTNFFALGDGALVHATSDPRVRVMYGKSSSGSNFTALSIAPTSTATSGTPSIVEISPTYNQTSGTASNTDFLINRTETAVGSGNQFLFNAQVGGASKFAITASGNVGIGTTAPDYKLHLYGASGNVWHKIESAGADSNTGAMYVNDTDTWTVGVWGASSNKFTITNSAGFATAHKFVIEEGGNVGIGTTAPSYKLHVVGDGYFSTNLGVGSTASLTDLSLTGAFMDTNGEVGSNTQILSSTGTATDWIDITSIGIAGSGTENYLPIWMSGGKTLGNASLYESSNNVGIGGTAPATTPSLYVGANGNVGIGTTGPGAELEVQAAVNPELRLKFTTTSSYGGLTFWEGSNQGSGIQLIGSAFGEVDRRKALEIVTTQSGAPIIFRPGANVEKMRITSGGNVGIGTTGPGNKLVVSGGNATFTDGTQAGIIIASDDATQASNTHSLRGRGDGSDNFIINAVNHLYLNFDYGDEVFVGNDLTVSGGDITLVDGGTIGIGGAKWTFDDTSDDITTTGNVGIGTTDPDTNAALQAVTGTGRIIFSYGERSGGLLQFNPASDGSSSIRFTSYSGGANTLYFKDASDTERLTLKNGGNVGIGSTSPGSKLGVAGGISVGSSYASLAAPTDGMIISGNVGIGTTAPGAKLDVTGTGRFSSTLTASDGLTLTTGVLNLTATSGSTNITGSSHIINATSAIYLRYGGSNALQIGNGGNNIVAISPFNPNATSSIGMRINSLSGQTGDLFQINSYGASGGDLFVIESSGNVGIGTTAPLNKIGIIGNIALGDGSNSNTYSIGRQANSISSLLTSKISFEKGSGGGNFDYNLAFYTTPSGGGSTTTKMFIEAESGNVGIGTTAPAARLEALGSGLQARLSYDLTNYANFQVNSSGYLGISASGSRVGIGLTNPTGILQIVGDEVRIGDAGTVTVAADDGDLYIEDALEVDGSSYLLGSYDDDLNGMTFRDLLIKDDGQLGYDSSSIRYKTNVDDMEDISWIYDLHPVNFEYKARNPDGSYLDYGNGVKKYGFIAEEFEEINSSFVFYDVLPDGTEIVEGIQYRELVSPVIMALQSQHAEQLGQIGRMGQIEEKTAALDGRVASLEEQMGQVEQIGQMLEGETEMSLAELLGLLFGNSIEEDIDIDQNLNLYGDLAVLGQTTLADTAITGNLTVGLMSLDGTNGSIATFAEPLRLQPDAWAPIEMMGGEVVIDEEGNLTVLGQVAAESVVADELATLKLHVATSSAELANKSHKTDETYEEDASVGSAAIAADTREVFVANDQVTANSRIFVTPTTLASAAPAVIEKISGEGFVVAVPQAVLEPLEFDYWIIN